MIYKCLTDNLKKLNSLFLVLTMTIILLGCNGKNPFAFFFQPDIKICDLYKQPSIYSDSLIELKNVSITKCSGFFRFYVAEISDGQCSIPLLSNKPFRIGENIRIKGRLEVIVQNNETSKSLFIDERMQGLKDIAKFLIGF
jgi:hypothetical protein